MLSACASSGQVASSARPAPTMAAAMADVDAAVLAGQNDKAYALLKSAGSTFPTDKTPWVRMAQMRFDSTDYGEAIVDALEALERDPDDTLANSIVAVSGLRVTSKALADLSQKNNLSGNVRTEAQQLAKLLRTSLGEEVLVSNNPRPAAVRAREGQGRRGISPPPARPASNDPFGALK
jgi:predicted Zn-dependent protease